MESWLFEDAKQPAPHVVIANMAGEDKPEQTKPTAPDPPQDDSPERERLLDPELDYLRESLDERIIEKKKA